MANREGIYKPKGRPFYYVRTDPITGGKISTGERTKTAAREWLRRRKNEAERRETDPNYAATQASFAEWCDTFLDRCEERGCSEATIGFYAEKLGHWVRILGASAVMSDVHQGNVDRYVSTRRKEGVSEHTIHKGCAILVRMLKVAKRAGVWFGDIDTLIPEDVKPNYEPRTRALPMEEIEALVSECKKPEVMATVCLCAGLGVRLSEAVKLDPKDIDRKTWQARVRGTKTKGSDRTVPVLTIFRGLVKKALPHMPIEQEPSKLHQYLKWACKRARIEYCSPNDLRRSFATILLEHGVSPDVVRRILGHTSDAMVRQIYGRTRPDSLRDQAESAIRKHGDEVGTLKGRRQRSPRSPTARKSLKTHERGK